MSEVNHDWEWSVRYMLETELSNLQSEEKEGYVHKSGYLNYRNRKVKFISSPDQTESEQDLSIVSDFNKVQYVFSYLERLQNGRNSSPHFKNDIRTLRLMMNILVPLLCCISKWQTQRQYLTTHLDPVTRILKSVIQEFEVFGRESFHCSEAKDLKPRAYTARFAISKLAKRGLKRPNSTAAGFAFSKLAKQWHWLMTPNSTAPRFVNSNLVKLRGMKPEMRKLYFDVSRSPIPPATGIGAEVVSFINSLLKNLNVILSFRAGLIILLKQQIETLQEKLLFLRNFLGFLSEICISHEFLVDLLNFAEAVAVDAACVLYFILVDLDRVMGEDMVGENKVELLHVVKKIMPFLPDVKNIYVQALEASRSMKICPFSTNAYAEGFFDFLIHNLRVLSNKKANFKVASNYQALLDELNSIRWYILSAQFHHFKEGSDNFMAELLDLIVDLGCFICSSKGLESTGKISDLLDTIQFIKSASGDLLIPRTWQSNFPSTNELGFIDFILMNMRELLHFDVASFNIFKCLIDPVYQELVALRHDFGEIAELPMENVELRALLTHFRDVSYQAEYVFDLFLCGAKSSPYQMHGLTHLKESISQVHSEVKAITVKITSDNLVQNIANSHTGVSSEVNPTSTETAMAPKDEARSETDKATYQLVGLEEEKEKIKEQLMGGPEHVSILSLVGMPGIGKTTLANSVYSDPEVTSHFHVRAWCSVSQVYRKEILLKEILHQVQRETILGNDLDQQVYKSLKGRRYLVILDDIWDAKVWDDLRLSFPDDNNGSKVMFTTRNQDVAAQAKSTPHALQLLSDEDSWKLLQMEVFKEETCPLELLKIGKTIAENCKGLPLAVVLTAGLLKCTEQNQDCWERVGKQLRSYVVDYRQGQQWGILELSYMHLPNYLKPCFLYFGAFKEDAEIPTHRLARLWIAEGFVQAPKVGQNSLEYEAENYLNDLIGRSLVIIAKRTSRGGVKACRIHDLLHDFCLLRAEEEKFLLQTSRHERLPTWRISEMHEQYRLCIHSHNIPSARMVHFESRVRTLLLSRLNYEEEGCSNKSIPTRSSSGARCQDDLKGIAVTSKFKLLRVLDLGTFEIRDRNDFITITHLVCLRYLAIGDSIREIPAAVANLKNLETFLLRGCAVNVPSEAIWRMARLRHLHIGYYFYTSFNFKIESPKTFERLPPLESLTTLSTPALRCDKDIEMMMRKLPNLRKLKCAFLDSWDDLKSCNHFPALDFLNRLESLTVFCSGKGLYPCNLSFPLSLKKLTLSQSRLPWDEISIIGKLPQLEVLKLGVGSFEGREWEMKEGEFLELKFLKLVSLEIAIWNVPSSEHLPHLEQLVLEHCYELEEIPPVLGQIPTLRRIDLKWCKPSAMHSVKQIEEEQHDLGNGRFNVLFA